MTATWPKVRLGEVMALSKSAIPSAELPEVNLAGVYSFGRGLFARGPMSPAETSYKTYNRLVTDDFVISQPKAWEGALARVALQFDGWYLSPVFPTFRANRTRLEPAFLEWFCKRQAVWAELQRNSRGIGARRETVSPETFLALKIPLPPLADQRRVVARIEKLAALIDEARALRQQASAGGNQTLLCMAHRVDLSEAEKHSYGWRRMRLAECIRLSNDTHRVDAGRVYPNLGIYSFGRGLFHKPAIEGTTTSATTLRRVSAGQFIYSRLFAFEGAYGTVDAEFDARFVSAEYPTFHCNPGAVRVEFLNAYFLAPSVWQAVAAGSKGLGDRRQRVQPTQLLDHVAWIPPMAWQNCIAEVRRKLLALQPIQAETAAELDALLPSIVDRAFKGEL